MDEAVSEMSLETGANERLRVLSPVVLLANRVCFFVCRLGLASLTPASFLRK